MSRAIIYNDLERIQRGRASRMPARVDGAKVRKSVEILGLIFLYALIYLQIQTKMTQTSSDLAVAQRDYLHLQNVQRDLVQQVAGLEEPARIQRLALAMGMISPQDKQLAQVYSAPWAAEVKPVADVKQANASSGNEKLSLWTKLFAFGSQAEAKATIQ